MLVVDTSVVVAILVAQPNVRLLERLQEDTDHHAPHLIDVEVVHALRSLFLRRELDAERASVALEDFATFEIVRYPQRDLRERMWDLRENLTAYDAAFVALAEALGVPLITCDGRVARARNHRASVEVF